MRADLLMQSRELHPSLSRSRMTRIRTSIDNGLAIFIILESNDSGRITIIPTHPEDQP
jgi:hypothetical protein